MAIDTTYSDPIAPNIAVRNATQGGVSARIREEAKIAKYRVRVAPNLFTPFAISLYGAPGPHAIGIAEQLAYRIARMHQLDYAQVLHQFWVNVSCTTMIHLSACVEDRLDYLHHQNPFGNLMPNVVDGPP
jgi:hypothetical protein